MTGHGKLLARLREARETAGLSQSEVARAMQNEGFRWYQQTIAKVELGQRSLKIGEALALAGIIGLDPADVVEDAAAVADPGIERAGELRYARVMHAIATRRVRELEQELEVARGELEQRAAILRRLEGQGRERATR